MKKFLMLLTLATLLFAVPSLAQDTTVVTDPGTGGMFPAWVLTLLAFLVGVYELAVRYYPTLKNYSILDFIFKIIAFLVPNRKADVKGDTHKVG